MTIALLRPLINRNVIILSLVIAAGYILLQIYILNGRLIGDTITGSFTLSYKITLLRQLLEGYFGMFPFAQTVLTLISALLIGMNSTLLIALMQRVKSNGSRQLSFGGMGIIALAGSGCPSCGMTLFSLLGPSYGVLGVFFHSLYIQLSVLGILSASIIYSLVRLKESLVCKINNKPITRGEK